MESQPFSILLIQFFLFTTISLTTLTSSASSQPSYTDQCASMVPNATPNTSKLKRFPHGQFLTGYYLRGDNIVGADSLRNLRQKQVTLRIRSVYETDVFGISKVGANLILRSASSYYRVGNSTHRLKNYKRRSNALTLKFDGFWSESSGKICMVGTGTTSSYSYLQQQQQQSLNFEVVLKLYNVFNLRNTISTLVTGSLESLSSKNEVSYFEPISLFILPRMDYEYTLDTQEAQNECSSVEEEGLSINKVSFCSNVYPMINSKYDLQYHDPAKKVFDVVSMRGMMCSDEKERVKLLIGFGNSDASFKWSFNPNTTLVGEGWWDEKRNQMCVAACSFLGMGESMASVHVGDCSTRMRLRFPKIWSINDSSSIVGQIWSNKALEDSGNNFKRLVLRSPRDQRVGISGVKYEYTQFDKVMKLCPRQNKNKGLRYPDVYSSDMRFDMSVRNSNKGVIAWGFSVPLVVNDQIQQWNLDGTFLSNSTYTHPFFSANSSGNGLYNISYKISTNLPPNANLREEKLLFHTTTNGTDAVEFSAEGIYDAGAGSLCMVGCRNIGSENQIPTESSVDCEIIVKFQFPPLDARNNGGYTKGSIESTRENSDPLYFKSLDLTSAAIFTAEAKEMISKIDMEVIMVLLCTMLACVFVGLQLYHVKRNPEMLPLISFLMLLILTLGNMIPLVLNFEALFAEKKNVLLGNEWLEVNEIAVRVIVMVAFLLQLRLLQLTWSARKAHKNHKELWIAEKKVLFVILPLYVVGFLIALLVHGKSNQEHSFWEDLKSYSGLVLDGFLLPQILLNLFWNSKANPLSCSFYFGTFLVRLLPHAYDLYESLIYVDISTLYEDEIADYYSTAWDVIIPLVGLIFAVIIYLQQKFGGRSILSWRIKGLEEYEKVPVVTELSSKEMQHL